MVDDVLRRLEADLVKIAGIRRASVIGDRVPTEIHVVASGDRPAKQVVRDVQSLASAEFGLPIDHRIVSVVQLGDGGTEEVSRPVLEELVMSSRPDGGTVEVRLRWPDGQSTEGSSLVTASREARAKGAAEAVVRALQPVLQGRGSRLDIGQVVIQRSAVNESVVVEANFSQNGASIPLIGSAFIQDDVASAAAKALLQAVNRKLR